MAISWDTYDKGDYDVYLLRVRFTDQVPGMDDPIPGCRYHEFPKRGARWPTTLRIACGSPTRCLARKWGKDFGAYDTTGIGIYQNHNIEVRC